MVTRQTRPEDGQTRDEESLRNTLAERSQEVEELRAKLATLESSGGQFLSAASHAVKNPLTIIQSYLEILHSDLSEGFSDQQLNFLGIAYDHVMRLRDLIEDLADLAALETRTAQLDIAPADAAAIIEAACAEIQPAVQRGGLSLVVEPNEPNTWVFVDGDRFKEVFQRLLENAVRFTDRGGTITIRTRPEDGGFIFEITDTGAGIDGDRLEEIFQAFVQLHRKPGEQREGYGLGLAISRRLIEAFGGTLTAESQVGAGSTFSFYLPIYAAAD